MTVEELNALVEDAYAAAFEFEEELGEEPIAIDDPLLFVPDRRGRFAKFFRPILLFNIDVESDPDDLEWR